MTNRKIFKTLCYFVIAGMLLYCASRIWFYFDTKKLGFQGQPLLYSSRIIYGDDESLSKRADSIFFLACSGNAEAANGLFSFSNEQLKNEKYIECQSYGEVKDLDVDYITINNNVYAIIEKTPSNNCYIATRLPNTDDIYYIKASAARYSTIKRKSDTTEIWPILSLRNEQ